MGEIDQFKQLLGRYLREARQQKGFTIQEVADNAETGVDHLGRIERGERQPTIYTFGKLCGYLGMDSNFIVDIVDNLKKHRPE
ncbi:hypothetical protein GCM10007063_25900 [Lentibacillus kapialis]|uniref:HTH cro/C1-type domain-containing protein n=1 Tax=Lentibacillus kapialis TaxID=340214 RepID=A0A917UZA5_9BACI|nr:helix-turn-helix transcriptional regulator [Lentibacillus kapialis]GGK02410.1 hypothetical protein GCM10007063_25900 [Lentibacillus kapialis]